MPASLIRFVVQRVARGGWLRATVAARGTHTAHAQRLVPAVRTARISHRR